MPFSPSLCTSPQSFAPLLKAVSLFLELCHCPEGEGIPWEAVRRRCVPFSLRVLARSGPGVLPAQSRQGRVGLACLSVCPLLTPGRCGGVYAIVDTLNC